MLVHFNFYYEVFYLWIFRFAAYALIALIVKQVLSTTHNSVIFSLRVLILLHIGAQLSKRGNTTRDPSEHERK